MLSGFTSQLTTPREWACPNASKSEGAFALPRSPTLLCVCQSVTATRGMERRQAVADGFGQFARVEARLRDLGCQRDGELVDAAPAVETANDGRYQRIVVRKLGAPIERGHRQKRKNQPGRGRVSVVGRRVSLHGVEGEHPLVVPPIIGRRREMNLRFGLPLAELEPGASSKLEDLFARVAAMEWNLTRVEKGADVDPAASQLEHGSKRAQEPAQIRWNDVDEPRGDDRIERLGDERRLETIGQDEMELGLANRAERCPKV